MTATEGPSFDVRAVLAELSRARPVFHSEADFQFAFAWTIRAMYDVSIRLETHPLPSLRLDVQLNWPNGQHTAIELKYKTRHWVGDVDGERFALKDQGANDIGGYDLLKDVERVERFVDLAPRWDGYVVMISNLATYWNLPNHSRPTNADAFRVHEGREATGVLDWRKQGGTQAQRPHPITLRDVYRMHWEAYSRLDASPAATLKSLVLPVLPSGGTVPARPVNLTSRLPQAGFASIEDAANDPLRS